MQLRKLVLFALVMAAAVVVCKPASAAFAITDLYSTGIPYSSYGTDGNYTVTKWDGANWVALTTDVGGNALNTAPVIPQSNVYPVQGGAWYPTGNGTLSSWIAVGLASNNNVATDLDRTAQGTYKFRTEFTLPEGTDLSSVKIAGTWASDDAGATILVNDNPATGTGALISLGYTSFNGFTLEGAGLFEVGENILEFIVPNKEHASGNNPVGLRVQLSGTYDPIAVPEASTFASWGIISMLGLALVGKYGSKLQLAA